MDIDLNDYNGEEVDEINLYRLFEDVHRANEAIDDDIGMRELTFEWDLNLEPSNNEGEVLQQTGGSCNGNAEGEGDVEIEVDDTEDEDHELNPPSIGDEFDSVEEAYKYYQLYGKKCGFGVCKRSHHKKRGSTEIHHYTFSCSKFKMAVTHIDGPVPMKRRGNVGTCCKACIKLGDTDLSGTWVVKNVILEHNHELLPETTFLISGYRYIPNRYQKLLEYNEDQGLLVSVNINLVIKTAGGYMRCPFTRRDAQNHIDRHKRMKLKSIGGNDALLLFEYFSKKEKIDREFFYRYEHTTDGRLWNIFWSDGRSRASYKYFHDVVVMDATYLTNR